MNNVGVWSVAVIMKCVVNKGSQCSVECEFEWQCWEMTMLSNNNVEKWRNHNVE
jgi:hypothetical protein